MTYIEECQYTIGASDNDRELQGALEGNIPGCGQHTSAGFAQLQPCASRKGVRP